MWKKKTHFVMRQRKFIRKEQAIPEFLSGRFKPKSWIVFCPGVWQHSAFASHASREHMQEFQTSRNVPSTTISRCGSAPDMRRKCAAGVCYSARYFHDGCGWNSTFRFTEFGSVMR